MDGWNERKGTWPKPPPFQNFDVVFAQHVGHAEGGKAEDGQSASRTIEGEMRGQCVDPSHPDSANREEREVVQTRFVQDVVVAASAVARRAIADRVIHVFAVVLEGID